GPPFGQEPLAAVRYAVAQIQETETRPIAGTGPEVNRSEWHARAVILERGMLEAQRCEQLSLDERSRGFRVTPGRIADHPRQQHEIAVGVPPLSSRFCSQARTRREGPLIGHGVLHLGLLL